MHIERAKDRWQINKARFTFENSYFAKVINKTFQLPSTFNSVSRVECKATLFLLVDRRWADQ